MKQNRFTKLLAGGVACAFALGTALAQDSSTTTTTGAAGATTTTAATTSMGTISAVSPEMFTVKTESSTSPMSYYYSHSTTVVDPDGKTVEISALRPEMPATFYYMKDGDRMVVTKVVLTKPISYYEKKETTTTTTTTP
jgi:hypothetical protein